MSSELGTTNLFLGILAVVSVLEALVLIGAWVASIVAYRKAMALVTGIRTRQMRPRMCRVNAILDDVKTVTATVKDETARVDHAINTTIHRIDDTADRVQSTVRAKTGAVTGFVRGVRAAIEAVLHSR